MTPDERYEAVLNAEANGEPLKFVHFWGHQLEPGGRIGHGCFSQWFASSFALDSITYPTAEHWMMAAKARLFGDAAALEKILSAPSPGAAKAAGREVRGYDEKTWRAERFEIVVAGSMAKFSQNAELTPVLLNTGERVLVEASPRDRIWGIGLAASDEAASFPSRWKGQNLLGFALMEARDRLRVP